MSRLKGFSGYFILLDNFAQAVGSFLSVVIIVRIGVIQTMVLGSLLCSPYVLYLVAPDLKCAFYCEYDPNEYILDEWFITFSFIYFSFINGIGQGITVCGILVYTGQCATPNKRGLFFSISWAVYMLSHVVGNIVAVFLLSQMDVINYVFLLAFIQLCGCFVFLTLRLPDKYVIGSSINYSFVDLVQESDKTTEDIYSTHNVSSISKPQQADISHSKEIVTPRITREIVELEQRQKQSQGISDNSYTSSKHLIWLMWKQLTSKKLLIFLPYVCWSAITIGFTKIGVDKAIINQQETGHTNITDIFIYQQRVLLPMSIGEIFGAFTIGVISDYFPIRTQMIFHMFIILITILFTLGFVFLDSSFQILSYFMSFFWGFVDGQANVHAQILYAFNSEDLVISFAMFNLLQTFVGVAVQAIQDFTLNEPISYAIYIASITIFGLISCSIIIKAYNK
eukprot:403334263